MGKLEWQCFLYDPSLFISKASFTNAQRFICSHSCWRRRYCMLFPIYWATTARKTPPSYGIIQRLVKIGCIVYRIIVLLNFCNNSKNEWLWQLWILNEWQIGINKPHVQRLGERAERPGVLFYYRCFWSGCRGDSKTKGLPTVLPVCDRHAKNVDPQGQRKRCVVQSVLF